MPVGSIPVNDSYAVLYYEDSGPPAGGSKSYLTLILIHGSIFHGAVFNRLIPHAASHNVRLVFLNTRDYPGSTSYSREEIQIMTSGDRKAQEEFIREQGREIAFFVERFVRANNVPRIDSDNGKTGGVVLAAWSMGNALSTSMLAHAASLPQDTHALLEQYLRTVVFYDASVPSLGVLPASGVYHPMRDTSLSTGERGDVFLSWVSSYFSRVTSLSCVTPALLAARYPLPEETTPPTVKRMTPSELANVTHFGALTSNLAMRQVDRAVYASNLQHALLGTAGAWAGVKVLVVWCEMSVVDCVWAAKAVADLVATDHPDQDEHTRREVQILKLAESDHFVHWDDPERLLQVLIERS